MVITIKAMETAEEIEGKSRVHWQTWREAYDKILPAEFQEQMTLDKCRFYSQKYPENTLIALDDVKVVGFVSYGDFRDSATIAGEIFALYVLKDYYGKGVGRQLMQEAFAALDNYQETVLWVLENNKRAIAFYEKMGFVFDGEEKIIDLGKAVKEKRMIYSKNSNS
ncbi:GNAT family N-acetyltransferase [Streptococcus sanguinis]|uniref:GNAT family N-acetyltransferase n=1 Tax=Streptococcus sanguinis TaxID=1305 RepID=UPI001CBEA56F|nr:GNAT family N-acetyltransferase [Streptococcus sanguinis]MBZ2037619.1 GNAT family N-acetyltransferase [Streptococcus sanguinis]MBZ2067716.1 GNAT family N-acetyltransferase [Streptococcus sanguinis]MBZ2070167.1 GNAT family N-acetyltransferase [Streptococcus sanguinis]